MERSTRRRLKLALLGLTLSQLVGAKCTEPVPPILPSLHHIVADPLFDMEGPDGALLARAPDEQTTMGSTAKIFTLHLVTWALAQGYVSLDDWVEIDWYAASLEPPHSVMTDANGVSLEYGELVMLDDLVRGMMYHSGNDAAYAIGEYIGRAITGLPTCWTCSPNILSAMGRLQMLVKDAGLHDTLITNPAGTDGKSYTTARELARMFDYAADYHPYFLDVVGFRGDWAAVTIGPNGSWKVYVATRSLPAAWEGAKGGSTPNCDGPNEGCMVASAKRLGRRLVVTHMQGDPGKQEAAMFDYGFAKLFHPDPRGASPWTGVLDTDAVSLGDGRVVVAAILPTGGTALATWQPDVDGEAIALVGGSGVLDTPKGGVPSFADIDLIHLGDGTLVTARRGATTGVLLDLWRVLPDGTAERVSQGPYTQSAQDLALHAVSDDLFLSARVEGGALVLDSWVVLRTHANPTPHIVQQSTYSVPALSVEEVDLAVHRWWSGSLWSSGTDYAVVASKASGGGLDVRVFEVNEPLGTLTLRDTLWAPSLDGDDVALRTVEVPFAQGSTPTLGSGPALYAAGMQDPQGNLVIRLLSVDGSGNVSHAGKSASTPSFPTTGEIALEAFGSSGLVSSIRAPGGGLRMLVWEIRPNPAGSAYPYSALQIADRPGEEAAAPTLLGVPTTHADGDLVSVGKSATGLLELRAWRVGDRPF